MAYSTFSVRKSEKQPLIIVREICDACAYIYIDN